MKRQLPFILAFILVGGMTGFGAIYGSVLGSRVSVTRPSLSITGAQRDGIGVRVSLRNNELFAVRAEVGFTLSDPTTNDIIYSSAPIDAGIISARAVAVIDVPYPTEVVAIEYRIDGWAREVIAYIGGSGNQSLNAEIAEVAVEIAAFRMVTLQANADQIHLDAAFDISIIEAGNTQFRYFISVHLAEIDEETIVLGERIYLSPYQFFEISDAESLTLSFSDEFNFVPGNYAVTLWVQSNIDGGYEHFTQSTYAQLLTIEADY